jgi:hypothetical protein
VIRVMLFCKLRADREIVQCVSVMYGPIISLCNVVL